MNLVFNGFKKNLAIEAGSNFRVIIALLKMWE